MFYSSFKNAAQTHRVSGSLQVLPTNYNHVQKSLGQSERDFNYMPFTSIVSKSSAVMLEMHVPSPFPAQYNVERSQEVCLHGFNTARGVRGQGRDVPCW